MTCIRSFPSPRAIFPVRPNAIDYRGMSRDFALRPGSASEPFTKIILPSTGPDLLGLLKSAIRDGNPVLCFEDANLWGRKGRGPIPESPDHLVPLGSAFVGGRPSKPEKGNPRRGRSVEIMTGGPADGR